MLLSGARCLAVASRACIRYPADGRSDKKALRLATIDSDSLSHLDPPGDDRPAVVVGGWRQSDARRGDAARPDRRAQPGQAPPASNLPVPAPVASS